MLIRGKIVSGVVEELTKLLSELHKTTQQEEKDRLLELLTVLREQDIDAKIWLMMMWFTMDQVRIIKYIHELTRDIKLMTEAIQAVDNIPEEEESGYSTDRRMYV